VKLSHQFVTSQLASKHSANRIVIGYSGGLDSHVLLHLVADSPDIKHEILAVYIHHGLQGSADHWAKHCQQTAENLDVSFKVVHVNAKPIKGQSPEEAARNARYQAFKKILRENDQLLFAQHRDDQLETVLLQLFRGAGLKGLSGMPSAIRFGPGMLIRPLLDVSQEAIKLYALQHQLEWVEDPSNQDIQFDRNYLRHEIIPLLQHRWPSLDKTISRVAEHCADAHTMLSTSANNKMRLLYDTQKQCLSISGLLEYVELMQQWIIREWLDQLDARMPSQKVMTAILQDVLRAQPEANPIVQYDGLNIQRYRDALYLTKIRQKPDLKQVLSWLKAHKSLLLSNNGVLIIEDAEQGISQQAWLQGNIQVKYRQGGEKIALPNRCGHHSLKKLYQEAGIAPWLRDVIPMIYIDGKLAAIAGYWISADFYTQEEACISLFWDKL